MGFFDFANDFSGEAKALKKAKEGFFKFMGGTGNTTARQQLVAQANDAKVNRPNDSFTKTLQQAASKPQQTTSIPESARDLVVSAGRGVIKSGASAGVSVAQAIAPRVFGTDPKYFNQLDVTNPIARGILGKEPIQSYQKRNEGIKSELSNKGLGGWSGPVAFGATALNAAGDLLPGGAGEKKLGTEFADKLVEASTKNEAKKVLNKFVGDRLSPKAIDNLAGPISTTKDKNVIHSLLTGDGSKITKEAPVVIPPPPKPVKAETPEPTVNPDIAHLENQIQHTKELKQHAATDTAKAKLDSKARRLIGEKEKLTAEDINVNQTPTVLPPAPQVGKTMDGVTAPKTTPLVDATVPKIPPTEAPVETPFETLNKLINGGEGKKGAKQASKEQADLLSKERGAKFAKGAELSKDATGSDAYYKRLAAQKGKHSQVNYEPLTTSNPQEAEALFSSTQKQIYDAPDSLYRDAGYHPDGARLSTERGIRKVLGLEPGIPTKSEIKLIALHNPEMADNINKSIPFHRKLMDLAETIAGTSRSTKSTADLSMGGRQGLFVSGRHPKEWAAANIESAKYAKSGQYYKDEMTKIHEDDWGQFIDSRDPSVLTGGGSHEEAYAGADILTGKTSKDKLKVGNVVAGAERAYTGGLTKLRKDILVKNFKAYGDTPEEVMKRLGPKGVDGLIEVNRTLTGRGGKTGGWVAKNHSILSEALFSPKLWASRLEPLNPAFWARIGPAGRKEAIANYGAFAAVAGTVLSAAAIAGATVETDSRSSDFLKVKVGDTRYDILGGFQQNLVFLNRMLSGETKSSTTGKITKYGDKKGGPTRLSATADLVRNKANPVIGSALNLLEGQDKSGNKINPVTEIGQLFVPISIQGSYNALKRDGLKGVAMNSPDLVGISTQTYGLRDLKPTTSQSEYLAKLKDSGASKERIDASLSFFQHVKTGPDRTATSEQIKKMLGKTPTHAEVARAQDLMKEYNTNLKENLADWKKQYPDYAKDKALVKEYNSRRITDETISRYVADIKKKNQPLIAY